jgi:Uma2 family endonuclease
MMHTFLPATVEDLYRTSEKAELVNGELVKMSPTGSLPSRASGKIFVSLLLHERETGIGKAYPDNAGFLVDLPNRKSFSPDAAFYIGPDAGIKFLEGAPVFAIDVGCEGDYGPQAEREVAQKRADYFVAGTLVVWDMDLLGNIPIRSYLASGSDHPLLFRRGEVAHAEPAVPSWTLPVDELFE